MPMDTVWTKLRSRFRTKKTIEDRHRIHAQVLESSTPRAAYYLLVVLSTTIAAFGLLAGSTAVVIGAMLVAPLMGPIFGMALALATGSRRLLGRAALSEGAGVLLCVALAALIGALSIYPAFGPEILARTKPTLYDIFVALASGLAGAYALVDERISPALPGVAIATALVPPLATCGLCLSAGQWDWALGAFLLFFANFLAIELAAALVFLLAGLGRAGPSEQFTATVLLRRFGLSLTLLVAVAVVLTRTLVALASENQFSEALKATLAAEVRSSAGAHLSEVQYRKESGKTEVVAVVLTPQEFLPEQVARIEESLRRGLDPEIRLVIRSLLSKDADDNGPVFITPDDRKRRAEALGQTSFLSRLSEALTQGLAGFPGTRLVDLRHETTGGKSLVAAVVHTPTAIEPASVARLQAVLQAQTNVPLRLTVRSVLTRDADAERYLYVPAGEPPPNEEERELGRRLQDALTAQLRRHDRSATLVEHRFVRKDDRLLLLATVRVRTVLTPRQVSLVEKGLRRGVDPTIDLVVRSTVGADATRGGYLASFDESLLVPSTDRSSSLPGTPRVPGPARRQGTSPDPPVPRAPEERDR
ncbi:MAG: DUF389 domain-containing protein [Deltaproteobacteria bacterium]|nr:DUF389 domain-containing protein [Deltaproteobacteria bacterium]